MVLTIVGAELAALVHQIVNVGRSEQNDILRVRVLEARHERYGHVEEDRRNLNGYLVDANDDILRGAGLGHFDEESVVCDEEQELVRRHCVRIDSEGILDLDVLDHGLHSRG